MGGGVYVTPILFCVCRVQLTLCTRLPLSYEFMSCICVTSAPTRTRFRYLHCVYGKIKTNCLLCYTTHTLGFSMFQTALQWLDYRTRFALHLFQRCPSMTLNPHAHIWQLTSHETLKSTPGICLLSLCCLSLSLSLSISLSSVINPSYYFFALQIEDGVIFWLSDAFVARNSRAMKRMSKVRQILSEWLVVLAAHLISFMRDCYCFCYFKSKGQNQRTPCDVSLIINHKATTSCSNNCK